MSLDVLPFVPAKAAAIREVARILRPGGRFAFTTWEQLTHPAPGDEGDPQRQALAATFHGHPLLQSARVDYRQLIEQRGPYRRDIPANRPAGGPSSRRSPKASSPPRQSSPATWAATTQP